MSLIGGMKFRSHINLKTWRVSAAAWVILLAGCGDTFRPVATPIAQPGGDPAAQRNAIILSSNGSNPGITTHVDVSGDITVAVHNVGKNPVHAVLNVLDTFIANRDDDTVTVYNTFGGAGASNTTITLPTGSCPVFVNSREAGTVYVASTATAPACATGTGGNGSLQVISLATLTVSASVATGINPVAVAELPNISEIYVVNQGSNNVTVINAPDKTVTIPPVAVGTSPAWLDVSSDSAYVFVANQGSNSVSVIATSSNTVVGTVAVGLSPTFLKYDPHLKRLYVANSGGDSISIINADPSTSSFLTQVTTVALPAGAAPSALTPLADGTRVYVADKGLNTVSVVSAISSTVIGSIPVGVAPVSIDSSADSTRVYSANSGSATTPGSGSISVIRTADNSVQSMPPTTTSSSFSPTWVIVTP
jgi:YVTN family beta-propeller protein